jgi:hypothetical protein
VRLVSKVQHTENNGGGEAGAGGLICDIRAKKDNNEKHTGRAKRVEKMSSMLEEENRSETTK